MKEKGFTLLEVLVAIVIFSIVFTLLIELETRYIKRFADNLEKLKALEFFKKKELGLSTNEDNYKIEKRSFPFENFLVEENIIFNKKNEEVLKINTYQLINDNKKEEF